MVFIFSSQQPRNFTENGSGDSPRESSSGAGTFFRNNERFNNGASSGSRGGYENRGGSGGNYKSRDGNYRAGSGRFSGTTAAASAAAPTSQGLRK